MASPATEAQPSTAPAKSTSLPPTTTPQQQPTTTTLAPQTPQQTTPPQTVDDGLSRRPRDARLIHLILSAQGVHSYHPRIPLQLLDFSYRYTSSVLSDALRLSSDSYTSNSSGAQPSKREAAAAASDGSNISANALRQAIASRQDYQFSGPALPKEFMLEQAAERNRTQLPRIGKSWGVQLPPERYCLTGAGWSLRDLWEEGEGDGVVDAENGAAAASASQELNGDVKMGEGGDKSEEKDAMDSFRDVFGGGEAAGGDGDGDHEMAEA